MKKGTAIIIACLIAAAAAAAVFFIMSGSGSAGGGIPEDPEVMGSNRPNYYSSSGPADEFRRDSLSEF